MTQTSWWREPTRDQWASFAAAWVGWILDAFDFTIFLLVMPTIAKEFGVSITTTAASITLTLLVRLLGGAAAGAAADRWGRKLPLMISLVWFAVCDGAVAFAPSFTWVLVLRTIFGFGMGAEWTAGATLAMENWPQRSRGIASGILQGSWALGYLLAAAVSAYVVPHYGWRALFLIAAAPALLALPIRIWVPESPEWKAGKATKVHTPFRALLAPALLRRIMWASVVMAFGFGGYYAFTGLYPTMLVKELGMKTEDVSWFVALFNVGMLCGATFLGTVATRVGVLRAMLIPAVLAAVVAPLYVGAFGSALALGAVLGGAFGAGSSGTTPIFLTSLFPADVRARAVGIVYHVGAFFAAFVPMGIGALHEHAGFTLSRAILLVVVVCELGVLLALLLPSRARAQVRAPHAAPAGA